MSEPRLNLKRALELSQGIEAAQKDAKEIQSTENYLGTTNRVGQSKNDTVSCSRFLGTGHTQAECKYRSAKCNKCYRTGHLARACKSKGPRTSNTQAQSQGRKRQQHGKQPNQVHHVGSEEITKEQSPVDIIHVHSITPSVPESYKVPVEINGSHLIMELDTGAAVSIVSETTWSEYLHNPKLEPSKLQLQSYPDRKLQVLGCCIVDTKIQNSCNIQLPLTVVEGQGPSLFGRNWLEKVKLDWTEIAKVNSVTSTIKVERLLEQYKDVVQDQLGYYKNVKAKLYLKPDAVPKFHRPRPLPFAIKAKVEKELERQEKLGIIKKVDVSEWGTPIVPVVKPSGAIRLCGDYKVTVNSQMQVNQY